MESFPAPIRTVPLAGEHVKCGARMVEFGGWMMPVQYTGIIDEHKAVRSHAGVFDISHMGEFIIRGPGAEAALNRLLTNDVSKLSDLQGHYTLMCNAAGGVIDDLILYRLGPEEYFLVVNASMIDEDAAWVSGHLPESIAFENISDATAGLALQGPKALEILAAAFPGQPPAPARNTLARWTVDGETVLVCRTGYTGEDGVELFFPAASAAKFWNLLLEKGASPAGLGARDTLRLEACLPLNGHELGPDITPIEAGLKFFTALDKPGGFIGSDVLKNQAANGSKRKAVAFLATGPGAPPRAHYPVLQNGRVVGEVTSGSLSPTLGKGIGLALVDTSAAAPGLALELEVRGRMLSIETVKKPLYNRPN
jgi:aminomethyltransferase